MTCLFVTSCDGGDPSHLEPPAATGISGQTWKVEGNFVSSEKATTIYNFVAVDTWDVQSSESWCTPNTTSGNVGSSELSLSFDANPTDVIRVVKIIIKVKDREAHQFEIKQQVEGAEVMENEWIAEYMKEKYLWNNSRIDELKPNYNTPYDDFFNSILLGVAGQGNANKEDGQWSDGKRVSFFSNISRKRISTRSERAKTTGLGIIYPYRLFLRGGDDSKLVAYILGVNEGSSAANAGLKRGDCIVQVNGVDIVNTTDSQINLFNAIYYPAGSTTITTAKVDRSVSPPIYNYNPPTKLNVSTYNDNPILESKVIEIEGGIKVGYLFYNHFELTYDDELVAVLGGFKAEGVTELVLDFRYNPGGHVISSFVMATAIAGERHINGVYGKMVFNAERTAKGEVRFDRIGDTSEGHTPLAAAMSSSFPEIKRVFVLTTGRSASASELIINGLRGLDITVNIIGEQTAGKNSGMEVIEKEIGLYEYTLAPITFYMENAVGFKDYHGGFSPTLEINESIYPIRALGAENEILLSLALEWIEIGGKPVIPETNQTRSDIGIVMVDTPNPRRGGSIVLSEHP